MAKSTFARVPQAVGVSLSDRVLLPMVGREVALTLRGVPDPLVGTLSDYDEHYLVLREEGRPGTRLRARTLVLTRREVVLIEHEEREEEESEEGEDDAE